MTTIQHGAGYLEQRLRSRSGNAAFIPFVVAGDPDPDLSFRIVTELAQIADAVEIGIPYSDPLADGPVIQQAAMRAISAGMTLPAAFDLIARARQVTDTPLIAFTYANPVIQYGLASFVDACKQAGADGVIIPDLPFEESGALRDIARAADLALIPLIALTSRDRVDKIAHAATGFCYCVSSLGVTGERAVFTESLRPFVEQVKMASSVPVAVGFGVGRPEQAALLSHFVDGVIVGSALVRRCETVAAAAARGDREQALAAIQELTHFAAELAQAGRLGTSSREERPL